MGRSGDRDFLFCDLCGTMLTLSSVKFAKCPLCNFKRSTKVSRLSRVASQGRLLCPSKSCSVFSVGHPENVIIEEDRKKGQRGTLFTSMKDIAGREIKYRVTAQDIRRELGISTFDEGTLQLATITRKCEKCGNDEFEYTRKQMRSADEGQTTFLTCTKCRDTITEN